MSATIASMTTPPSNPASASTGTVAATRARTGASRAASFPSTISESARSVTSMWVRVPRARSRQIVAAVAAGATISTSTSCMVAIAK